MARKTKDDQKNRLVMIRSKPSFLMTNSDIFVVAVAVDVAAVDVDVGGRASVDVFADAAVGVAAGIATVVDVVVRAAVGVVAGIAATDDDVVTVAVGDIFVRVVAGIVDADEVVIDSVASFGVRINLLGTNSNLD